MYGNFRHSGRAGHKLPFVPKHQKSLTPGRCGLLVTSAIKRDEGDSTAVTTTGRASLAYTDQTEPAAITLRCPYSRGRVIVELYSGSIVPDRCRSNQCRFCVPLNARRRCLAITYAGPQRMIRLSLLADRLDESPARTALQRVKLIRRNLKRMGRDPGEWCLTIERNPKGTGYHAHCLQRGSSIPQAELQEACVRAGAGFPYIESIKREGIWTSRYGLKGFGADGYGLKTFRPNGNPQEALKINNGRLEHHSRGFYATDGSVLRVREMESMAISVMNEHERVAFIGCTAKHAESVLRDAKLRDSLIRDVQKRHASKLRALA